MTKTFFSDCKVTEDESKSDLICKSTAVEVLGNTYSIREWSGKYHYVNITKETNNPGKTIGKDFKTWDEATRHYKSPQMKTALLMTEINFKTL